ncbi:MAG TPA: response regulator [Planktothrix sp.]|jgi:CheY-like chemotaxis protein
MPAQALQILLIEDSQSDAALMQARLSSVTEFAFTVDHATRLSDAIEMMENSRYDAILVDLNLPDSSGLDTVRKTRKAAGETPVIVLTAMDDRTLVAEAIENGADSYLVKDKADGNRIAVGVLWAMRNRQSEKKQVFASNNEGYFSFETFLRNEGKSLRKSVRDGMPLFQALEKLLTSIETSTESKMLLSVLLLDEQKRLHLGAAPSLPEAYNKAVDGMESGPTAGSCGTAAHCGHPVYVVDIETDPLWKEFKALALPHGLRACWSLPIIGSNQEILGTLATYYLEKRGPSDAEKTLMKTAEEVCASIILASRERKA